jgi:glutamate synthase domain-containing protein 2
MDREELPFNRAQRSWAYRAAKNVSNTVAFGSTLDATLPGTVIFVNCAFPTLGEDGVAPKPIVLGDNYCAKPYATSSLVNISGMSYGAISKPAVQALSRGAAKAGCWLNTGEGGLSPFHLEGNCDIVFQIGTAKNGVRDPDGGLSDEKLREIADQEAVKMFEIKLSQGAKPGKGGLLPGRKVTAEIAEIRGIPIGSDAISPNRHTDLNNNNDILKMIHHIREITGKPVGIKTVIGGEDWLEDFFTEINALGPNYAPDFITVDSADGGTGAAPMPLIDRMGLPLRESLPIVVDGLNKHKLRDRIKVIASGKLTVPSAVAWALCIGADFITTARGFMFALGCIQALQCNKNTCPTGITTHNKKLQRGLNPILKSDRVANYVKNLVKEVGIISHSCGVTSPSELRRRHARIVQSNTLSIPLDKLHPPVK